MSSYAYSPLEGADSIRVLALNPTTQPNDPLSGSLLSTTLSACHFDLISGYTALSYVWGPPETPGSIFLDQKEVRITASLYDALRDLRDSTRIHYIWADALCINQNDIPERNAQVALMGDIYWTANHTVIHLGSLTDEMSVLLMAAHLSHSLHRQATAPIEALYEELKRLSMDEDEIGPGPSADESLPALIARAGIDNESYKAALKEMAEKDLLQRPWFRRVWTYQELILSRQVWVQCGRQRAWWSDVCNLLLPLVEDKRLSDMNESRCTFHNGSQSLQLSPIYSMGTSWTGLNPLWEIMHSRRGSQATDPRDIVFAFMALHSDRSRANRRIRIDYSQSLEEVFIAAAQYVLESIASSQLMLRIWGESITSSNLRNQLPSWVPDWGVIVPDYSPFLTGDKATTRPVAPNSKILVFAPLGYRVVKRVSRILPRWAEYPQTLQEEISKWKKFEEARKTSQSFSMERVMRERNFRSPGLRKEGAKQWRQVVRRLWKEFVRPLGKDGSQHLPFLDLLKTTDLWDLYYLMDIYFPDEGSVESVLESDYASKQFSLYEASDGTLGFILSASQAGDYLVDACTFPPASDPWNTDVDANTTSREALAGGTNFKDSGPKSALDRFTMHNQRTFFLDRGGTFVIRPYHTAECDDLTQHVIDDLVREAPLRGCAGASVDMLQSRSVQASHYSFVGFHHEMDDDITGCCWWSLDRAEVRLKGGRLVKSSDLLTQGTMQDDRTDSDGSDSLYDTSRHSSPVELFVIH